MMRILLVSRYVLGDAWQGSAQHVKGLKASLEQLGHEVMVLSGEDTDDVKYIGKEIHFPLQRPNKRGMRRFLFPYSRNRKLYSLTISVLKNFKPDIVHLGALEGMLSTLEAIQFMKIRHSVIMHDFFWFSLQKFEKNRGFSNKTQSEFDLESYFHLSKYHRLYSLFSYCTFLIHPKFTSRAQNQISKSRSYAQLLFKNINMFFVQNQDNYQLLNQWKDRVPPSALLSQAAPSYAKIKVIETSKRSSAVVFGYVGRVSSEKGLEVLFKALKLLPKNSYELIIVSKGIDRAEIIDRYPSALAVNFILKNNINKKDELLSVYHDIDILVCPSVCPEIGPRTVVEAISCGVPVILSDSCGNRFLVKNGWNGLIFQSGSITSLVEGLMSLILNPSNIRTFQSNLPTVVDEEERVKMIVDYTIGTHNV